MAYNYSKVTIILTVAALLLSLLLIQVAESRVLPKSGSSSPPPNGLICTATYGAEAGDTCFSIAKSFNLTTGFFDAINPNLDCDKIFVAQWLCIDGFTI